MQATIAAWGVARSPLADLPALRKDPGRIREKPFSPSLLKHADLQAVLGLAALAGAVGSAGWFGNDFDEWGVVGASRFLGRIYAAHALEKFRNMGAPSVSPLIIPYHSLHSLAGTISMALKSHGPNFGAGGGPGHVAEGLTAALSLLAKGDAPGVWVIFTGWDPEPIPDLAGSSDTDSMGTAVALALTAGGNGPSIRLRASAGPASGPSAAAAGPAADLIALAAALEGNLASPWSVPWGTSASIELAGPGSGDRT